MSIKTILFDLDGTLLPMDNDEFTKIYIKLLAGEAAKWGYDPEIMVPALWKGTGAMVKNDGSRLNCEAFWSTFDALLQKKASDDEPKFDAFYVNDFNKAKAVTGENVLAVQAVALAKEKAEHVVLATNPLFPPCAVKTRLSWIRLPYEEFDHVTNYKNSGFCKPNPSYYMEIMDKLGVKPEECLMVGNDVDEDIIPASDLGMSTYLITDCLINRTGKEMPGNAGSFREFIEYLSKL